MKIGEGGGVGEGVGVPVGDGVRDGVGELVRRGVAVALGRRVSVGVAVGVLASRCRRAESTIGMRGTSVASGATVWGDPSSRSGDGTRDQISAPAATAARMAGHFLKDTRVGSSAVASPHEPQVHAREVPD